MNEPTFNDVNRAVYAAEDARINALAPVVREPVSFNPERTLAQDAAPRPRGWAVTSLRALPPEGGTSSLLRIVPVREEPGHVGPVSPTRGAHSVITSYGPVQPTRNAARGQKFKIASERKMYIETARDHYGA